MAPHFLVNRTSPIKNTILIVLLGLIGCLVLKVFYSGSERTQAASHSAALVSCYRAEMLMRIVDAIEHIGNMPFISQSPAEKKLSRNYKTVVWQARDLLDKAFNGDPNNVVILSKKIILESQINDRTRSDINRLMVLASSNQGKISANQKELAKTIIYVYGDDNSEIDSVSVLADGAAQVINTNLSDGWFREQALLKVYKLKHDSKDEQSLQAVIENKTWHFIFKVFLLTLAGSGAAVIGIIVLIYQLVVGFTQSADSKSNNNDRDLQNGKPQYNWQTVAFVFIAWFFTEIVIAFAFVLLKDNGFVIKYTHANSFYSAIAIALVYLLSNGPALLYIYFLALRPNGQSFIDGINLRLKIGIYGPIALITVGVLGWFAALPLVIIAYFVSATLFGSSGSSNPILGIVMEAAQTNNIFTVLIFYLTLGVLAPLCEETLFRGFFYTYLRGRYSIWLANLISSVLFAIAHMDIGAVLPLFTLGSIFAFVYEKTKSILPAMVVHGLWNSVTFTLVLMLFGNW